jgi:hypothetical protein
MTDFAGPFDSHRQACDTDAVKAVYAAASHPAPRGTMGARNFELLDEACLAARVELGAYDRRIIGWLSGWEPEICAVVAGLIRRAYAAGTAAGNEVPR